MKDKCLLDYDDVPVVLGSPPITNEVASNSDSTTGGGEVKHDGLLSPMESPLFSSSPQDNKVSVELKVCKQIVDAYLSDNYKYRNDDDLLIRAIHNIKAYRKFKSSTIIRVRRQIQNEEGRLLPTDPKVIANRMNRSESFRKHFGGVQNG
jgi:hypothetical protein